MNQFSGLTADQLIAIAEPDHANLHALRTQASAARRYAIELAEATQSLNDLADRVTTLSNGRFTEAVAARLAGMGSTLTRHGEVIGAQAEVVDDCADEADAVYTDLTRYRADREAARQDNPAASPSETAILDDMENEIARQRMQQASDYYLERVNRLEPDEHGPSLQSGSPAPAAPTPATGSGPAPTPSTVSSTPVGIPTAPMGSPPSGTTSTSLPGSASRPITPGIPRPGASIRPLSNTARPTLPRVIGERARPPVPQAPGVRTARTVHPSVIGERAPRPPADPAWRPTTRGPRGFTESVLGREPGAAPKPAPFTRDPNRRDGLTRPVIGSAGPEPARVDPAPLADDPWTVSARTVPSVITGRESSSNLHDPGPVSLAHSDSTRPLPEPRPRTGGPDDTGGLLDRLHRVEVHTVTGDRNVAARLTGAGALRLDVARTGTDLAALARAIRAAMVAALHGRDAAAARIVGAPVTAEPGRADPLTEVEVESRSRLGYVRIRWIGRSDVSVHIDHRAHGRLNHDQLLSEVNGAASDVLRRHREHLTELNRRHAAAQN